MARLTHRRLTTWKEAGELGAMIHTGEMAKRLMGSAKRNKRTDGTATDAGKPSDPRADHEPPGKPDGSS